MSKVIDRLLDLDNALTGLSAGIEVLEDIETLLGHLREDMDTAKIRGWESIRLCWHEQHRSVRILSGLLRHQMKEMNAHQQEAHKLVTELMDKPKEGETV